jgi:hypothetical protein
MGDSSVDFTDYAALLQVGQRQLYAVPNIDGGRDGDVGHATLCPTYSEFYGYGFIVTV